MAHGSGASKIATFAMPEAANATAGNKTADTPNDFHICVYRLIKTSPFMNLTARELDHLEVKDFCARPV